MLSYNRQLLSLFLFIKKWIQRKYQSACLYCFLLSFIRKHKKIFLFPIGILFSYGLIFILFLSLIYLCSQHKIASMDLGVWIQHFGFHWYYLLFLLIYHGLCNFFLIYFNLSLTAYVGHELQSQSFPFWFNFKLAFYRWTHILWTVLIGNLFLSSKMLWNLIFKKEPLDRLSRLLVLPIVIFENKQGLEAIKQSQNLMRQPELRDPVTQFSFGWLPGFFLSFLVILIIVLPFIVASHSIRMFSFFGLAGLFIAAIMLNMTIYVVFQTLLFLDSKRIFQFFDV